MSRRPPAGAVLLRTLVFTVLVPGTVTVLVPAWILSAAGARRPPGAGAAGAAGAGLILIGVTIYLWCAWDFASSRGTPAPVDPPKELVVRGLYRVTRNPMYVGVGSVLLGEALLFGSLRLLGYAALVLSVFHLFVVAYEEPTLRATFGDAYVRYCARVPRWPHPRADVLRRFAGRGPSPGEPALRPDRPPRRRRQPPARMTDDLGLAPDARVLGLGPGPGFFSPELAARLSRGRMELCDLRRGMLARTRRSLRHAGRDDAGFTQADAARLPYRSGAFDAALLVAVRGEVADPRACLCELHRVLVPAGLLSVTELPGDPDDAPRGALDAPARAAGFEPADAFGRSRPGRGRAYTAHYRKPSATQRA